MFSDDSDTVILAGVKKIKIKIKMGICINLGSGVKVSWNQLSMNSFRNIYVPACLPISADAEYLLCTGLQLLQHGPYRVQGLYVACAVAWFLILIVCYD